MKASKKAKIRKVLAAVTVVGVAAAMTVAAGCKGSCSSCGGKSSPKSTSADK